MAHSRMAMNTNPYPFQVSNSRLRKVLTNFRLGNHRLLQPIDKEFIYARAKLISC